MTTETPSKTCSQCGGEGPFYMGQAGKPRSQCKKCCYEQSTAWFKANPDKTREIHRVWKKAHPEGRYLNHILQSYGLTESGYDALFLSQNGACAVCERPLKRLDSDTNVDHDHKTGLVRGLLCRSCNVGIGHLQDDPVLLRKAAEYVTPKVQCFLKDAD